MDLLEIAGRSGARAPKPRRSSWTQSLKREFKRRRQQANSRSAARRNVAHHYDLSNELYRRFLDADLQYSCGYRERPDMTLDEAQAGKKKHIADKLMIRPGHTVLDIGSGWGGLAMTLARDYGAKVIGVTLSTERLELARERARAAGLADRVDFQLADYRDVLHTASLARSMPARGPSNPSSSVLGLEVASANPTLPKTADDHRCAARSLRRHVDGARRERLRCRPGATPPPGSASCKADECL